MDIYNPQDFPFGILSNHALFNMTIDGKLYGTVTNFTLSNFLITPLYKNILHTTPIKSSAKDTNIENKVQQIIANIKSKKGFISDEDIETIRKRVEREVAYNKLDIYGVFNYFLQEEYNDILKDGVLKAYNTKALEDEKFVETLLSTENRPIKYISDNTVLSEYLGTVLMQIRKNLQTTKKVEKMITNIEIVNIYRAMILLQKELTRLKDLSEYVGKTPDQIVSYYLMLYPNETLISHNLGPEIEDNIVTKFRQGSLPYIQKEYEFPGFIVLTLRKDNIRLVNQARTELKNRIIVSKYTEHVIKTKYPNMDDKDVKDASSQLFISAPDIDTYEELREKIISMFKKGILPDTLIATIREAQKDIDDISEETIQNAEQMIFIPQKPEEKAKIIQESSSSSDSDDELKHILRDDNDKKKRQFDLAQKLEKLTGLRNYYKMPLSELEKEISKYRKGYYTISILVDKIPQKISQTSLYPFMDKLKKIVDEYNLNSRKKSISNKEINLSDLIVTFIDEEEKQSENIQEYKEVAYKGIGDVIEVHNDLNKNNPKFISLSPSFVKRFVIDNLEFSSVSIYLGALTLTQTGITSDFKKDFIHQRGVSLKIARSLLMRQNVKMRDEKITLNKKPVEDEKASLPFENNFIDISLIPKLFKRRMKETKRQLLSTLARIGMAKKFTDVGLMKILSLTGKAELRWIEPKDLILGFNVKKNIGENIAGKILMEIRENLPSYININQSVNIKSISRLFLEDEFFKKWLLLKLKDLTGIVYKFKKYLEDIGKQSQNVNAEFAQNIINIIYKNCNLIKYEKSISMPAYFTDEVKMTQKGLSFQFTQNYDKKINDLVKKMENNEKILLGREVDEGESEIKITSITEYEEQLFNKTLEIYRETIKSLYYSDVNKQNELNRAIKKYLKKEYVPEESLKEINTIIIESKNDVENYKQILESLIFGAEKQEEKIKDNSFAKLLEELEASKYSDDEITLRLIQEKKRLEKKKMSREEIKAELLKLRENLRNVPKYSANDKRIKIDEYRKAKWKKIVPEDKKKKLESLTEINQQLKKQILYLNSQRNNELMKADTLVLNLAEVYWKHLSSIIQHLVVIMNNPEENVLKKALIGIDIILKQRNPKCQTVPISLDDNMENCIVSALVNILGKINTFKYEYSENLPFGSHDIDLARVILLGKGIMKREDSKEESQIEEDVKEFVEEDIEQRQIEDLEEREYDEVEQELEEDSVEFGMQNPQEDTEKIRMILRQVIKKNINDMHVKYFMDTVDKIVEAKIPQELKMARINFFATLK
jgi:predicted NAD-dependent protein-ADP-ribosyltransferase YbiA (DUF1768 family)